MKDVHTLASLGDRLMSISDSGVTIQNGAQSSLIVEVKKKKDSDPISLELNWRFSPKGKMVYFATRVDCVLLMEVN